MKNLSKTLMLTTTFALAFTANAHDPSMHAKKAPAKADCSSYNEMVESGTKMDMSDPVMMAMMKKCKNQKSESKHDNVDGHHDEKSEKKCGDMAESKHAEKGDKKCGDMSDGHHDKKGDKKCGDNMKKAARKVEKNAEEHGKHDH